MHFRRFNTIR